MECLIACRDYPNCECGWDGREIEEDDCEYEDGQPEWPGDDE